MARTNIKSKITAETHEDAPAWPHAKAIQRLRRSVLSCLLWESEFYEDGEEIAKRIASTTKKCLPAEVAALAVEARSKFNLRHAPLMLLATLAGMARGSNVVSGAIAETIQRADELAEFVALYAKINGVTSDKVKPKLSAQVKKGLAKAFTKFDAYRLAKYNRDHAVKLRDVLFLCHAKPKDEEQAAVWKQLVDGTLPSPDTWEVSLSAGKDKKETWERLLKEGQLGYLALLRNLRNMTQVSVDSALIRDAIVARKGAQRILPFRYVAAARACPQMEDALDQALLASLGQAEKLPGKTIIVVDISGSMCAALSAKSDLIRLDAACALAAVGRELCDQVAIYATSGDDALRKHATALVPSRHGMALIDAIPIMRQKLGGGGIFLKQVMDFIEPMEKTADRIIVITDEQDCGIGPGDSPLNANAFGRQNYVINVASYRNGIGYGKWTHIDGFSENVFQFIQENERPTAN